MDAFTILVVFLFGFLILRFFLKIEIEVKNSKKNQCPPHKWEYIKQPDMDIEYLQCKICRAFPGRNLDERV